MGYVPSIHLKDYLNEFMCVEVVDTVQLQPNHHFVRKDKDLSTMRITRRIGMNLLDHQRTIAENYIREGDTLISRLV